MVMTTLNCGDIFMSINEREAPSRNSPKRSFFRTELPLLNGFLEHKQHDEAQN